jgi:hypothetical protein
MRFAALTAVLLALGLAPLAAMADHVTLAKGVTKKDDRLIVEAQAFGPGEAVFVPHTQFGNNPWRIKIWQRYLPAGVIIVSTDSDDYTYSGLLGKNLAELGETEAAEVLNPRLIEVLVDGQLRTGVALPAELRINLRKGNGPRLARAMPTVAPSPDKFTGTKGQYAYVDGDTLYVRWGESISREAAKKEAAAKA